MKKKYDPEFEEKVMERLFAHFGAAPERLIRDISVDAHSFYKTEGHGVELEDAD